MRRALRLPAPTARLRLTGLYAGLLLLLAMIVIAVLLLFARTGGTVAEAIPHALTNGVPSVLAQQRSADVNRLVAVSGIVLVLAGVAAVAVGWFAAGRVLRPLRAMTATAQTISAGNLHQRLSLNGPDDEIKQLGDTLDDLLARLEASFEAQRRFVAHASHELRTPLTLERTLLQVALADPDASATTLRATCEELLAAGRDRERLLDGLLTLASSERGLERFEPLDLADPARRALDACATEVVRHGIQVTASLEAAPTVGDPALVARLIGNLVDNAVRHNVERGSLEVRTKTDGDRATVTVTNTGEVIAAEQVERLLEPFQHLEEGRTGDPHGHHGFGLSIVRAIAAAHGAVMKVAPQPGGGLSVTVSFPG